MMIKNSKRFKILIHYGSGLMVIGSLCLLILSAYGALTRSGWAGAQDYIQQTRWILFWYAIWLGLYLSLRARLGIQRTIVLMFGCLLTAYLFPSILTMNFTSIIAALVFFCMLGYGSILARVFSKFLKFGWTSWPIFGNLFTVITIHTLDVFKILNQTSITLMIICGNAIFLKEIVLIQGRKVLILGNENIKHEKFTQDALVILVFPLLLLGFASNGPDMLFDSLAMKAWLPRQWFVEDSLFLVMDHLQSGIFGSGAYFLLQGNYLGSSNIGPQFQYLSLLYIILILVSVGVKHKKTVQAIFLAYLFATIPAILWQVSGAYDDVWLTLLSASGILTIMNLSNSNMFTNRLVPTICGLVGASLFLGKLSQIPFVIVALLAPSFFSVFSTVQLKLLAFASTSGIFVAGILVPVLWRWVLYGNPVWPLYNGIFRAESLPPTNEHFNLPMGPINFEELILAPISSFFNPGIWVEGGSIGLYSFSLASAYLGVTFLFRRNFDLKIFLVGFLSIVFLINWWISFRYLRYTFTIVPIVFFALILSNLRIYKYISDLRIVLAILIISVPAIVAIPTGNPASPDRIPFNTIVGRETVDQYRLRSMPAMVVIDWLNKYASPNAKIVGYGSVFYQRLLLRSDLDIYYDWELTPKNSKKIDYVLKYKQANSSILENSASDKCLIKTFNNDLELYGECK
jgi:hypothetical protein